MNYIFYYLTFIIYNNIFNCLLTLKKTYHLYSLKIVIFKYFQYSQHHIIVLIYCVTNLTIISIIFSYS